MGVEGLVFLIIGITFFSLVSRSFIIINQYEEGVKFRYGRYVSKLTPGINFIIPLIDVISIVDMRIRSLEVPSQKVITKDNTVVKIEAVIYYRPTDAEKIILNVAQYELASIWRAQTSLRAIIGDMTFDNLNSEREHINKELTNNLKEITESWGIKIISAEIGEVSVTSAALAYALAREVRAERIKRACILESEGTREAAVLNAQGIKQATETLATGLATAKINIAQGESGAIEIVSKEAQNIVGPALSLWELNTWKRISSSPDATVILPYNISGWMECMNGIEGQINKKII